MLLGNKSVRNSVHLPFKWLHLCENHAIVGWPRGLKPRNKAHILCLQVADQQPQVDNSAPPSHVGPQSGHTLLKMATRTYQAVLVILAWRVWVMRSFQPLDSLILEEVFWSHCSVGTFSQRIEFRPQAVDIWMQSPPWYRSGLTMPKLSTSIGQNVLHCWDVINMGL